MHRAAIVPDDFAVPAGFETDRLRLRMLSIHDAVKDFDAVMTSKERLQAVFRPGSHWPEGLTLEQNILELAWHQVEFQHRTSFAYTVVARDESSVLGCLYIYPTDRHDHDVTVTMWVRQSEAETGLDDHLFEAAQAWIARDWPFKNPAYPGRISPWSDWQ